VDGTAQQSNLQHALRHQRIDRAMVPTEMRAIFMGGHIDDWEHSFPILRRAWDGEATRKEATDELRTLRT
jgi:hypothetical protein